MTDADKFFDWYFGVIEKAGTTDLGKKLLAAGYTVSHTGGGCLAWERTLDDGHYLWVCDEGNGFGDTEDEMYLVGCYNEDGEFDNDGVMGIDAALAWCNERATDPARFIADYQNIH